MEKYIELHLHLDGAVTPEIAVKLAALQGLSLPASEPEELQKLLSVPETCRSLNDFLKCFALPLTLLQTREGISEAVRLVLENIRSQGVIYAELRFAPQLHCSRGLCQRGVIEAALDGLHRSPIPANLILCCMRGADEEINMETVNLAAEYLTADGGVVALDLAGAEALFPTQDYAALFARARALGIPFTIHAGEAAGPESVRAAVDFGARRIGHGVHSAEDPGLLRLLCEKQIPLELCPTSNLQTCAVSDLKAFPLKTWLRLGIPVTVNTDDMAISRTTLAREFALVTRTLDLTPDDLKKLRANAVNAAFTSEERREQLRAQLGSG